MLRWLIICIVACLTGCASTAPGPDTSTWRYEAHQLTDADRSALDRGVRPLLRDPESARFGRAAARKLFMPGKQPILQVCGYVNARNGFGGYTGEQLFVGVLQLEGERAFKIIFMGGDQVSSFQATTLCQQYGLLA